MNDLEKLAQEWLGDNLIINDEAEPNAKARNWIFQLKRLLEKTHSAGRIEGLKEALKEVDPWPGSEAIRARIQELEAE